MSGDLTTDFLSLVLPFEHSGENVWFNAHWSNPNVQNPKHKFWSGKPHATLSELNRTLTYRGKRDATDVYICMSSQSRTEERVKNVDGTRYIVATRLQENVVRLKSFYIDIDVKKEAYATKEDALDALKLFIDALDLPMPSAVVESGGGGMHVHWAVDRPLTLGEWQPIAYALAGAIQSTGLIADTQCTIDSARILRVPGTLNHKYNPPRRVELLSLGQTIDLEDFSERLAPYKDFTPVGKAQALVSLAFPRREIIVGISDLSGGIEINDVPKPSIYSLGEVCPFVADALAEGGSEYNNPLWFLTTKIAVHTSEGPIAAHLMSNLHSSYTEEETDRQYERIANTAAERDIGWPSCLSIQKSGATQCAGCPHIKVGKSPFNFVVPAEPEKEFIPGLTEAEPIDVWPDNYSRRKDGVIILSIVNEDGSVGGRPICPYPISGGWLQNDPKWVLHFKTVTGLGRRTRVEIPCDSFGAMGGARKILASFGVVLSDDEFKFTQGFLVAWIQKLQTEKGKVLSATPFGWVNNEKGGIEGFSYAGHVWSDGSSRPAAQKDREVSEMYTPHGELDAWLEASRVITDQDCPELNVILALAFAAPLMKFVGHEGLLISAWSNTGTGKSSAVTAGLSVWGHPKKTSLGLDDTANSTFKRVGVTKNLPVYWDEVQEDKQIADAKAMIFHLTRGIEKARLNRELEQRERGVWKTIMCLTANISMLNHMQQNSKGHSADLMRIFEFQVPERIKGRIATGKASRIFSRLEDHHGQAGLKYSQFLGANCDRVQGEVEALQDGYGAKLEAHEKERYWVGAVALTMAGARYSNELGLTAFKLDDMESFLSDTFKKMRGEYVDSPGDLDKTINVVDHLSQFLTAMRQRHTIVTNVIHRGQGKPPKNKIQIVANVADLNSVNVHIGHDDGILRINYSEFLAYLDRGKKQKVAIAKALVDKLGAKRMNGRLGAGTAFVTGDLNLFEMDMTDPRLKPFLEGISDA